MGVIWLVVLCAKECIMSTQDDKIIYSSLKLIEVGADSKRPQITCISLA